MFDKNSLINLLESNSISYKITEHKPLFTVEDSKNLRGSIDGAHSKNPVSYTHLTLPTILLV